MQVPLVTPCRSRRNSSFNMSHVRCFVCSLWNPRTTCGKELNGNFFGMCVCPVVIHCLPFPALDFVNKCLCSGSRFCSSDTCTRVSPTIPMRCFPSGLCVCLVLLSAGVCGCCSQVMDLLRHNVHPTVLAVVGQRTALWRVLKCAGPIF